MLQFEQEDARLVSLLHDVVEDGDVTFEQLRAQGFPDAVVTAIGCLTKQPGEAYEDFIARLAPNALARRVKIADIRDNMDLNRLSKISDTDLARVKKYHAALRQLMSAQAG